MGPWPPQLASLKQGFSLRHPPLASRPGALSAPLELGSLSEFPIGSAQFCLLSLTELGVTPAPETEGWSRGHSLGSQLCSAILASPLAFLSLSFFICKMGLCSCCRKTRQPTSRAQHGEPSVSASSSTLAGDVCVLGWGCYSLILVTFGGKVTGLSSLPGAHLQGSLQTGPQLTPGAGAETLRQCPIWRA